jgi:hypothetical protein
MPAHKMNRFYSIVLVFLLSISSVNFFTQIVVAQPDFYIYVYDSYGNSVSRAEVIVYQNGQEVDRGRTNSNGFWITQLNRGDRYSIEANKGSQSGSWGGVVNGGEVSIYMN